MDPKLRSQMDGLADGVHRCQGLDKRPSIIKKRRGAAAGFFAAEADGLQRLRAAAGLRVPQVLAVTADALIIEDLGHGTAGPAAWRRAGQALARQHRHGAASFGLERDGWCGDSLQLNTPMQDGWRFFAECRLLPQGRRARDNGWLQPRDIDALERLCAALPGRIPPQPPALLHGDLWMGNLHPCTDGELALIDAAAVHYGWAETDLAMLTMFGEPPAEFFDAYQQAAAVDSRWRTRAPLYNLYHLLNHLNLFGSGYLPAVRKVLQSC